MYPLKSSTGIDILFFAHDANGDPVTGKVDGDWTKNISKTGAAFAAMTVTITERAGGFYLLPLSSTHTNTQGIMTIYLTAAGVKQVNLQFRVWASAFDELAARLPAALVGGRMAAIAEVVGDKSGYALTTAEEDAIVNKVWDELTAEARTAGSYGQLVKDDINAPIASRATPAQILATPANVLVTDASGRVTVGSNADKTGYAIGVGGIGSTAFAAGAIDAAAIAADAITSSELALSAAQEIADELLKRDMAAVTGEAARSLLNAIRFLRNKWSIAAGTLTVTKEDDSTPAWTGAVTQTAGNPVSAVDPV